MAVVAEMNLTGFWFQRKANELGVALSSTVLDVLVYVDDTRPLHDYGVLNLTAPNLAVRVDAGKETAVEANDVGTLSDNSRAADGAVSDVCCLIHLDFTDHL